MVAISIPNIPTSESGPGCLQTVLNQIFPNDNSQLMQSTLSISLDLNSTEPNTYSWSENLPPQDFGMIISTILSLSYNIPCRDSHILNPSLKLLIKSSISRSGGHPTPGYNIPQDLRTIFEHLQL
ncbi:hypothetical protein O181_022353 [Austropuccinia psidii MF-1]|uniref:Uncharacterized protein n=1 Tax=Austropuccinia psidii MF-1 TaxID=1389203 RepID=A0A9Q3CGP1_9BASI|nr:hypothetical protein [Austropuccinia psidii MF-1]